MADRLPSISRRVERDYSGIGGKLFPGDVSSEILAFHGQDLCRITYSKMPGVRYAWSLSFADDRPGLEGSYLAKPSFQVRRSSARELVGGYRELTIRRINRRRLRIETFESEGLLDLIQGPGLGARLTRAQGGAQLAEFPLKYGSIVVNPSAMIPAGSTDLEAILIVAASGSYRLV